ncbi:MAG: zinc-binding dehydrogenase, partial [Mameliella sp.]|nr:zinc-binding dehydrogenase [Phaeodactylibacter sp.]
RLKIVMDRQYPLEKVAEAHTYISAGRKKGNVVITSSDEG